MTLLGTCLAPPSGTVLLHRVLIVEPETILRLQLRNVAADIAAIDAEAGMPAARQRVIAMPYDWLITNIRLQAYNGLHLAYLARMSHRPINILVYGDDSDLLLAREAQGLGAFYESRTSILNSLAGYLASPLPPNDRRNAAVHDRRTMFRGGRRSADVAYNDLDERAATGQVGAPPRAKFSRLMRIRLVTGRKTLASGTMPPTTAAGPRPPSSRRAV